jgi:hypothetical protein
MNRFQLSLQTASRQGYAFAVISKAIWLGCGSNFDYIVSKHKTRQAAERAFAGVMKNWIGDKTDVRLISTEVVR